MSLASSLSRRFSLGRGVSRSTTTGAVIAVAGVALALMVMEISLAVSVGFKQEIRRKVVGFAAPVSVLPPHNYATGIDADVFEPSDTLIQLIERTLPGTKVSLTMRRQAILKTDSDFNAVECIARGEGHDDNFEQGNMVAGKYDVSEGNIVISQTLADKLQLEVGSRPYMYFFVDGNVKARRLTVSGIYCSNFGDYDNAVVYAPLATLQKLSATGTERTATSVDVEGLSVDEAPQSATVLSQAIVDAVTTGELTRVSPVTNITQTGAMYFNWLDLLDTNVVVIFVLMLCVAGFTLISSLFIIILDRVSTIGILRSLGASKSMVSHTFVLVAMRLVIPGVIIGNILGIGFILVQHYTHALPLNPEMYYLSYVPVAVNWLYPVVLTIGTVIATWLILILPARLAAKVDPAATMRYQ